MVQRTDLNLPRPPFLYTLDQVAGVLNITLEHFMATYVYFWELTSGPKPFGTITARNIAPMGEKPDWRIVDTTLENWLKSKGFRPRYNSWE